MSAIVRLCDTCPVRGHCCKRFDLHGSVDGLWSPERQSREEVDRRLSEHSLPFQIIDSQPHRWLFSCSKLTADGKCSIYETRPELCRSFLAGSDPLCVLYVPRRKPEMHYAEEEKAEPLQPECEEETA